MVALPKERRAGRHRGGRSFPRLSISKRIPLGRMYARKQIDQSQFLAGRTYQQHHDAAIIGSVRSIDLSKTKVSGGLAAEPLTDHRRRAAAQLRAIEARVQRRYGDVWVCLVRAVLAERRPVEPCARGRSALR
jgi:hypothetical protein